MEPYIRRSPNSPVLRVKSGWPRTCSDTSDGQYSQSDSAGGRTGMVLMLIGMY